MRSVLIAAAAIGLCSSPVLAGPGVNPGIPDATDLELTILGRVSPKCEISLPDRRIQTVLTDGPGGEKIDFGVDCNQTLTVTMSSTHGGFEHSARKREQDFAGFASFLPYRATFSVKSDGAQPVSASSEDMIGGASGSIGTVPYRTSGLLELDWNPEHPLLGGTFEDVIEIRVSGAGERDIRR